MTETPGNEAPIRKTHPGYATRGEDIFRETFAFNGGNVAALPLPAAFPVMRATELETLATKLAAQAPSEIALRGIPTAGSLATGQAISNQLRGRMISIQEELDWEIYRLYGLISEDLTYSDDNLPGLAFGERAFEIALARAVRDGKQKTAWFSRHKSSPVTEIPAHWPVRYQEVVQRRLNLIASDPFIKLLEKPEYKRRWMQEPWDKRQEKALRQWLLDRLEERRFWFDPQGRPWPRSISQLTDEVGRDVDLTSVLALMGGPSGCAGNAVADPATGR